MIITKEIEITLVSNQVSHYENLGYEIPRKPAKYNNKILTVPVGTKLLVKVSDLPLKSNIQVEVLCDYCGDICFKKYAELNKSRLVVNKDCCSKCIHTKLKETNMINYGVEHTSQLESTQEKRKETNLKIYGSEHAVQNEKIKNKIKNIFIEKYGTTSPAKNEKVKEKIKQTNIERYGAVSPTLNEEVRSKQISTLKSNYGVEFPQQNSEIRKASMNSMYENKSAPCSRQQKYIHNLVGGELNFPHNKSFLDIAFVDEKLYLEIDLGGHELQMKLGNVSKEEYENKERNRWYALYRKGWKEIRIISKKDKIPNDDKLLEIMSYAKEYLNTGRHYIKFYLDEGKVITSQFEKDFDFGDLRYIYKKNSDSLNNAI